MELQKKVPVQILYNFKVIYQKVLHFCFGFLSGLDKIPEESMPNKIFYFTYKYLINSQQS